MKSTQYILMAIAAINTGDNAKIAETSAEIKALRDAELEELRQRVYHMYSLSNADTETMRNNISMICDNNFPPLARPDLYMHRVAEVEKKYNPALYLMDDWNNDHNQDDRLTQIFGDGTNYDWTPISK